MTAPKTFEHAAELYAVMQERANSEGIFEGSKVSCISYIGVSRGLYSKLFGILDKLGCIVQEQKGGRGTQSRIRLIKPPELDDYLTAYAGGSRSLTSVQAIANLERRMANVEGRLPGIDLSSWIMGIERELAELKLKLDNL